MILRSAPSILTAVAAAGLASIPQAVPAQPVAVQPATAAAPGPVAVAILPFQERGAATRPGGAPAGDDGGKVTDLLFASLVAEPALLLIEREDLRTLLDEQALNLSGLANPAEAIRVGQLTGAKILVTGSVLRVDNSLYLVAKVIGTETSRVLGASVKGTARDDLGTLAESLATEIVKVVTEREGELLPKPVTREDRLAALAKALPAGTRPVLLIEIEEQHLGAGAAGSAMIDPAAETEVTRFAKDTGFEVVDAREGNRSRAAVILEGEAISEPAMRHGNLVSAKARLELKAIDQSTGKVLAIDRQTTVATDLTEQIAAKTALQEAAAMIAERLLPKIAAFNADEAGK